eukprot:2578638-Amphidinium_carterae.1
MHTSASQEEHFQYQAIESPPLFAALSSIAMRVLCCTGCCPKRYASFDSAVRQPDIRIATGYAGEPSCRIFQT